MTPVRNVLLFACALVLAGCSRSQSADTPQAGPPEVGVATIAAQSVAITAEVAGRTSAYLVAEVRPQVSGIIQKRLFTEGGEVRAGQALYQIDPATYEAAVASAQASLARADANLANATPKAERYRELAAINAVSIQEHDEAQASLKQARAEVLSAKAALDTARINLGYTKVVSPISGRIGKSAVTPGALVTASQAAALARVQQLDPMYVDLTQSSADLLRLQRELAGGALKRNGEVGVKLLLEDGTPYPLEGKLQFSDITVEQTTGTVTLRAIFPNPEKRPAARPVRARADRPGRSRAGHPRAAAGRDAQRQRRGNRARRRRRRQGGSPRAEGEPRRRQPLAGDRRPAGRRQADRRWPAKSRPRRAGQAGRPDREVRRLAMVRFFIDRPIFAWVIAIVVMLAGALAIFTLPISQYPPIAPPEISIVATYPGASAKTIEDTVTQVIEQEMKGLDGFAYLSSTSDASGRAEIRVTFDSGVDPDIAQVQVQNKLALATPQLPQAVQRQGVTVAKSVVNFLLLVAFVSEDGSMNKIDIDNYVASSLQDPISRVSGVGETVAFGSEYAMRIWLDSAKLHNYKLTPDDISRAIIAQNAEVSAGQLGGMPAAKGQQLNATVTAQSLLQTPEQFGSILLRTTTDGAAVRLRDVARIELGGETYNFLARYNGKPVGAIAIRLTTGANALETAQAVKDKVRELEKFFPPGLKAVVPYDTTPFVRVSIQEVVKTLFEAIVLVFLVMYLFLQNWRATLIPTIAVPVVLLGTFGVLAAFGYSINTLTMFGMVLAIGLLVDDAIVVVENVERVMQEEGLSPKEATRKSMGQITGALVGIALVLSAVFVPMAFFGGSTGVIYRQFSITLVSSMALSVLVALILTPALCATLLKPAGKHHGAGAGGPLGRFFAWFNRAFERSNAANQSAVVRMLGKSKRYLVVYGLIVVAMGAVFVRLPTAFLPDEDQGLVVTQITLPAGATTERTLEVVEQVEHHFLQEQKEAVDGIFAVAGFSFAGRAQNQGFAFVQLKDWSQRDRRELKAPAVVTKAMAAFSRIRTAQVFAFTPPAVVELGNATGFDFQLQDRAGLGHQKLMEARNQLLGMAAKNPVLTAVRPNGLDDTPEYRLDIDLAKAGALALSQSDINNTIATAWGSSYVNDFIDKGRVKRVYLQSDAPARMNPEDFDKWYVRNGAGEMVPFSAFASAHWSHGSQRLERFNGMSAVEILGQAAPGRSTGEAMAAMEEMAAKLPAGIGFEWTGLSYQERLSGSQAPLLYAISLLVVFLCLAALYESWSIPVAVMLVVPLGVIGAVLAAWLRGLPNDIYLQIGLLTTVGISAKNAILIVEFARDLTEQGKGLIEATLEATRQRLRPILMTSFAFILGVLPLAISSGAGSGAQNAIGTSVIGGMFSATVLAVLFVPLFFVVVRRLFAGKKPAEPEDRQLTLGLPEEAR